MAILAPGTFRVSDYRKPIPERVKRAALVWTIRSQFYKVETHSGDLPELVRYYAKLLADLDTGAATGDLRFDHRPPLQDRKYDTTAHDFIPPQNDHRYIEVVLTEEHDARTVGAYGRTERGDADRRKRVRSVSNKHEDFQERQKAKAGQAYERRADIPPPTKGSQKPKAKIRSRSNWPKGRKIAKRPKKERPRKTLFIIDPKLWKRP